MSLSLEIEALPDPFLSFKIESLPDPFSPLMIILLSGFPSVAIFFLPVTKLIIQRIIHNMIGRSTQPAAKTGKTTDFKGKFMIAVTIVAAIHKKMMINPIVAIILFNICKSPCFYFQV